MPAFLLIILGKIWKPLLGASLILFALYGIFHYGKINERRKWEQKVLKETIKREREERIVRNRGEEVIKKFRETKGKPMTDKIVTYYECLLGNNPLDCTNE